MHPFCCSSPVPISPAANPSSMPLPPPQSPPPPARLLSARSAPPASPPHSAAASCPNGCGWPTISADPPSSRISLHDAAELRLNDIVGNGVAGILHKWVNYGRGWRPRWFLLHDGVLSYHKIRGIKLIGEADKGSKLIGEDSLRFVRSHRRVGSVPVGEVHLKVASVRASRSDDRRFSIFTGTKRLHLRAETREDRAVWVEALQTVKEMFPRMSNSELMAPADNFVVSTDRLRQRLQEEGVSDAAIQSSEQIMRAEFVALQGQLAILKQKQLLLTDTLRQLEVWSQ